MSLRLLGRRLFLFYRVNVKDAGNNTSTGFYNCSDINQERRAIYGRSRRGFRPMSRYATL